MTSKHDRATNARGRHTPGPWEADEDCNVYTKDLKGVHLVDGASFSGTNADARLIAAAPDLLEALKKADRAAWGDYSWVDEARAAIAKAEGRS